MTNTTRTDPPLGDEFLIGTRLNSAWYSFIQGLYDITGASKGVVQFKADEVRPKVTGRDLNIAPTGKLKMQNITFMDGGVAGTTNYLMYADTATSVHLGTGLVISTSFSTGDIKMSFKPTADSGWILLSDKTVGNAISGATERANADTSALFLHLWDNYTDAQCPVSGGRGGSAQGDYDAGKTITLPKLAGRAPIVNGTGAGLSARTAGDSDGTESHALTIAQIPAHTHKIDNFDNPNYEIFGDPGSNVLGAGPAITRHDFRWDNLAATGNTYNTEKTVVAKYASGAPANSYHWNDTPDSHNNMQDTVFVNFMIKL